MKVPRTRTNYRKLRIRFFTHFKIVQIFLEMPKVLKSYKMQMSSMNKLR